jgi:hypothetical protein
VGLTGKCRRAVAWQYYIHHLCYSVPYNNVQSPDRACSRQLSETHGNFFFLKTKENLLNDDNKRKIGMIIDVIQMKLILNKLRYKWFGKKAATVESDDIHDGVDESDDEDFSQPLTEQEIMDQEDEGKFFGPKK